jgi:hypothetical protein
MNICHRDAEIQSLRTKLAGGFGVKFAIQPASKDQRIDNEIV